MWQIWNIYTHVGQHFRHGVYDYWRLSKPTALFTEQLIKASGVLGEIVTRHAPGHHGYWLRIIILNIFPTS